VDAQDRYQRRHELALRIRMDPDVPEHIRELLDAIVEETDAMAKRLFAEEFDTQPRRKTPPPFKVGP
jgi:hypothetical protein